VRALNARGAAVLGVLSVLVAACHTRGAGPPARAPSPGRGHDPVTMDQPSADEGSVGATAGDGVLRATAVWFGSLIR
jgi:hypothetical protein